MDLKKTFNIQENHCNNDDENDYNKPGLAWNFRNR